MISKKTFASLLASAMILPAALAFPDFAAAGRSISGVAGDTSSTPSCLSRGTSGAYNYCDWNLTYFANIPVDASGSKSLQIGVSQVSVGDASCRAIATDLSGNLVSWTAYQYPSLTGKRTLNFAGVSVPGAGTFSAQCSLKPGAGVTALNY